MVCYVATKTHNENKPNINYHLFRALAPTVLVIFVIVVLLEIVILVIVVILEIVIIVIEDNVILVIIVIVE